MASKRSRGQAPGDTIAAEPPGETVAAPLPDTLTRELVELGLSNYEARVLLALLQVGSANTVRLTQLSGVPRTSTYQILESLAAKRVAERVPGPGPAVWGTPGREDVLERLEAVLTASYDEGLRQHRARSEHVRQLLAANLPEALSWPCPSCTPFLGRRT